jgi:hypothetical protein
MSKLSYTRQTILYGVVASLVIFLILYILLILYQQQPKQPIKEGFGKDANMSLQYAYTGTSPINVYVVTDASIKKTTSSKAAPQTLKQTANTTSPAINMKSATTSWIILQPAKDSFPDTFDLTITLDMAVNDGYFIDIKPDAPGNTLILNNVDSKGSIDLGTNVMNITTADTIVDENKLAYGSFKIDKSNESKIVYKLHINHMYINFQSIVIELGGYINPTPPPPPPKPPAPPAVPDILDNKTTQQWLSSFAPDAVTNVLVKSFNEMGVRTTTDVLSARAKGFYSDSAITTTLTDANLKPSILQVLDQIHDVEAKRDAYQKAMKDYTKKYPSS